MTDGERCDLVVAVPSYDGKHCHETTVTLEAAMVYAGKSGITMVMKRTMGSNIARNRCMAVTEAQKRGAKHLLFVDSDTVIPRKDSIVQLLNHKVPVVSGMYYGKQPPFVPIAARLNEAGDRYDTLTEWPENQLIDDIHGVGGGFLLIETRVFDDLKPPYFCFEPFQGDLLGEDYYFCRRAIEAGYKIHLDTGIQLGHVGSYIYSIHDYMNHKARLAELSKPKANAPSIVRPSEVVVT